jgi:hypothetical protein
MLTLSAITLGSLYYSFSRVDKEATFESKTTDALDGINKRLDKIDTALSVAQLEKITATPIDKSSALAAQKLITDAQAQSIKLPTDAVEQAGEKLVAASTNEPAAWDAALQFVNYRSTYNSYPKSAEAKAFSPAQKILVANFFIQNVPGKPGPVEKNLTVPGVESKSAARYELIGQNINKNLTKGPQKLIFTGGAANIDGEDIEHVVFQNVEIHYSGKPLILQDVIFINCIFVMENMRPARQFVQTLLASSPIDFETTG